MNEHFRPDRQSNREPKGRPDSLKEKRRAPAVELSPADIMRRRAERLNAAHAPVGISRRNFVRLGGAALIAAGMPTTFFAALEDRLKYGPLADFVEHTSDDTEYDFDEIVSQAKAFLKERYGIRLTMGPEETPDARGLQILAEKTTLERYQMVVRALVQEISKYPPEMIAKIRHGHDFEIRIGNNFTYKYTNSPLLNKVGGVAPQLTRDRANRFGLSADSSEPFTRRIIHHELNHKFAHDDRKKYDKIWIGIHKQLGSSNPYREERPGVTVAAEPYFLSEHAAASPQEDQAETADTMLTPLAHYKFLQRWQNEKYAITKQILRDKYIEVKREYLEWSDGKIDETFWQQIIAQGTREAHSKKNGS